MRAGRSIGSCCPGGSPPVVAIGGIHLGVAQAVRDAGADGMAAISEVTQAENLVLPTAPEGAMSIFMSYVVRHPEQVRPKPGRLPNPLAARQAALERLLDQILRLGWISHQMPGEGAEPLGVLEQVIGQFLYSAAGKSDE